MSTNISRDLSRNTSRNTSRDTSRNLSEGLNGFMIPGAKYGYTGMDINALQSFENTIAVGLVDESGSTTSFAKELEACVKEIVRSLRDSDYADKLLYAHYHFSTQFKEIHGFKELNEINVDDYDGCWDGGGVTTLYDSEVNVIQYLEDYGEQMRKQRYLCNGILYVLTDGQDYGSTLKESAVTNALKTISMNEGLESFISILIGINDNDRVQKKLEEHANKCGFSQYVKAGKADQKTLSKIAGFVERSISSQSQMLGTGGPSQLLTF